MTNYRRWRMTQATVVVILSWLDCGGGWLGCRCGMDWRHWVETTLTSPSKKNLVRCSILYKEIFKMKLKENIIIFCEFMTERRCLEDLGTWRMLLILRTWFGVWILEWPTWVMIIPAPFAICTWSLPWYFSFIVSRSRSLVMWSVAPVSIYQLKSMV